ncbi:MAG: hypothetical protein HWN81_17850 [Candidatus Lokiarchaeota archaeon]|nr:hypothetical protein [Candidatus Lokiarchaeota archaeon]
MAITEVKKNVNISHANIQFICPVCKIRKYLEVPKSVIEEAKQLTTMSIASGLVCEHQFQAFVDKNYQVRGYQRVDFEFEQKVNQEKASDFSNIRQDDKELFENLVLEGNYVEYKPKKIESKKKEYIRNQESSSQKKKMTLKDIYNEFWELIDDDNDKFKDFIKNDLRRSQNPLL